MSDQTQHPMHARFLEFAAKQDETVGTQPSYEFLMIDGVRFEDQSTYYTPREYGFDIRSDCDWWVANQSIPWKDIDSIEMEGNTILIESFVASIAIHNDLSTVVCANG